MHTHGRLKAPCRGLVLASALSGVWSYSGRFHLLHHGGPANAILLLFLFGPDSGDNSILTRGPFSQRQPTVALPTGA